MRPSKALVGVADLVSMLMPGGGVIDLAVAGGGVIDLFVIDLVGDAGLSKFIDEPTNWLLETIRAMLMSSDCTK